MLAPVKAKTLRKAVKRLRRKMDRECPRGALIRLLLSEGDPSVPILRPSAEDLARLAYIDAGKAYCVARCGGCELTEGYVPPA